MGSSRGFERAARVEVEPKSSQTSNAVSCTPHRTVRAMKRSPPPPPVLTGHVSSFPPVRSGHVSPFPPY